MALIFGLKEPGRAAITSDRIFPEIASARISAKSTDASTASVAPCVVRV
jgi:hypothetical protein